MVSYSVLQFAIVYAAVRGSMRQCMRQCTAVHCTALCKDMWSQLSRAQFDEAFRSISHVRLQFRGAGPSLGSTSMGAHMVAQAGGVADGPTYRSTSKGRRSAR